MAYLWQNFNNENWIPTELSDSVILSNDKIKSVDRQVSLTQKGTVFLYAHHLDSQSTRWILFSAPESRVSINDEAFNTGMRILADRDAITVAPHRSMYISMERHPEIETFGGTDAAFCPRCKLEIQQDDQVVCCPQCLVFHHHKEQVGESCWEYAETCTLCNQPTELNSSSFNWTPEEL
jgi:hypothetical protein